MRLPRTEAQALIPFHSQTDFIPTAAVVLGSISSPPLAPVLADTNLQPVPPPTSTSPCAGEEKPGFPSCPHGRPGSAQHLGLAAPAPPGVPSRGHSWLSIPSWPCKGLLCIPGHLPALTIPPFKVPRTPRLGATTGLPDQVNPALLRPGHPCKGHMGEQTSYSLLRDLVGSGAWYTAHWASTGLTEQVFGRIPHIALELEQKPNRTKSCPLLHPGKPPDVAASCMQRNWRKRTPLFLSFVCIMNSFQLNQESASLFELYIFTLSTKSLMSFQWRVI